MNAGVSPHDRAERRMILTEMVRIDDAVQLAYWCRRLSVSEGDLKKAVFKTGRQLSAVAAELARSERRR